MVAIKHPHHVTSVVARIRQRTSGNATRNSRLRRFAKFRVTTSHDATTSHETTRSPLRTNTAITTDERLATPSLGRAAIPTETIERSTRTLGRNASTPRKKQRERQEKARILRNIIVKTYGNVENSRRSERKVNLDRDRQLFKILYQEVLRYAMLSMYMCV